MVTDSGGNIPLTSACLMRNDDTGAERKFSLAIIQILETDEPLQLGKKMGVHRVITRIYNFAYSNVNLTFWWCALIPQMKFWRPSYWRNKKLRL